VPAHGRMRAIDRDLIRGGYYGQRPSVPHSKAEHMAAPTNAANVKKVLANSAPMGPRPLGEVDSRTSTAMKEKYHADRSDRFRLGEVPVPIMIAVAEHLWQGRGR